MSETEAKIMNEAKLGRIYIPVLVVVTAVSTAPFTK